ncbi:MAG TPA: PDDEXK nuclease domain-containing protein [Dongiaceae bacterium]|nr:PDDEXK nuclease domain-containing protein [Dongiaceae bacterium]
MNFNELVELMERTDAALRRDAVRSIDRALVARNWLLGRHIIEYEQSGLDRAQYGERLLPELAQRLGSSGRKGFSETNLRLFRQFYRSQPEIHQTVSDESSRPIPGPTGGDLQALAHRPEAIPQTRSDELAAHFSLPWSHYAFLIQITSSTERRFYEIEAAKANWSLRELKRQFSSGLYERLAMSRDKTAVQELGHKGHFLAKPADAVKDPYVLEFLGLQEHPAYSESDLEQAIIDKLEHFLLELGKGFLFHSRQFRLTFDEKHFRVDLVFYNRLLRCFVLLDLKIGDLTHQDLGQMQMYVNYFDRQVKCADENPTIGIMLCKTKNDALVEMTLPESISTIFASRYQLYLPSKEQLKAQLREMADEQDPTK